MQEINVSQKTNPYHTHPDKAHAECIQTNMQNFGSSLYWTSYILGVLSYIKRLGNKKKLYKVLLTFHFEQFLLWTSVWWHSRSQVTAIVVSLLHHYSFTDLSSWFRFVVSRSHTQRKKYPQLQLVYSTTPVAARSRKMGRQIVPPVIKLFLWKFSQITLHVVSGDF